VLLRLPPGETADPLDLQAAANLSAYFSQARESDQAPIVYTQPKHVYKPKGAKLGMVIYKQETILWGYPQQAKAQFFADQNIKDS
jgi:predicted ribosome quality control (RQC) complex YloA/Tae2 family protein